LKKIISRGKFDIIHSHSRLASLLASIIAKKYCVPFVTTAHARFKLSGFYKRFSRWGEMPIAVSEDLLQYLCDGYDIAPERVNVIPNGVDSKHFCPSACAWRKKNILFLSRLDSDCSIGARLLCHIAPRIAKIDPEVRIIIGGAGSELRDLQFLAEQANEQIGYECVSCVGAVRDTAAFFRSGDIFVGVSRAAIEAGMCGLSVVLCGDEGYLGRLHPHNFLSALSCNFCARGEGVPEEDRLFEDLYSLLRENKEILEAERANIRELFEKYCSARACAEATERHYFSLIEPMRKRGGSLLCGYYGYSNMGDDALLLSSIERARREFSDDPIRALTRGGRRDSKKFGIKCARRYSIFDVPREVLACKRLIFGGGTLLQSGTSRRSLMYYCSIIFFAHACGKKIYLWGNGIGDVKGRASRSLCRLALARCSFVEMRDLRSFAIARHIVGERARLDRDLCERARIFDSREERIDFLLKRMFGTDPERFVIAVFKGGASGEERLAAAKKLITLIKMGVRIGIVVMYEREDGKISDEMSELLGKNILRGICFSDLCGLLKRAEGVYSMRLHALVAAKIAGCEMNPLSEENKIASYCRENAPKR
jgi:polysaccharide pyruvyl transferase CsaB